MKEVNLKIQNFFWGSFFFSCDRPEIFKNLGEGGGLFSARFVHFFRIFKKDHLLIRNRLGGRIWFRQT